MRFSSSISPGAADATLLLLLLAPAANAMLQCESIVADGKKFNLKPLGGAHSAVVSQLDSLGTNFINTTYTTDICQSLKRKGDVDRKLQCPQGTRGMWYPECFLLPITLQASPTTMMFFLSRGNFIMC